MKAFLQSWLALGMIVALASCAATSPPIDAPITSLAIIGVTVVDVETGARHADQTVVVDAGRITQVGATAQVALPVGATPVDGHDKFLIPGLWDMHVHAVTDEPGEDYRSFFPLFVATGVTGVRDMWGDLTLARELRQRMADGTLLGPRLVVAGNLVDGSPPVWPGATEVVSPEQGRAVVDSLEREGAPFVKVYSRLPADAYFAIARRARELGIPFAGHVPFAVRAADAAQAGQRSMEHLYGIPEGCSSAESTAISVMASRARAISSGDTSESDKDFRRRRFLGVLNAQDARRCEALLALFRRTGTWQVPTLIASYGGRFRTDPALRDDPRLRFLPNVLVDSWRVSPDRDWAVERAMHVRSVEIVRQMAKAGVAILAGSDTPNPYVLPGFGLHDELALLVRAGLTPLQALQTATLEPARFLEQAALHGTIAPGKVADLVLLDADPLEDIRNTARIHGVVLNGRLITREAIDALLQSAAKPGKAP